MASYSELIRSVITDFDEIYTVLRLKGSKHNNADLIASGDTGIATSDYANIINTNLVKVEGLNANQLSLTTGGQIANKTGQSTVGTVSVDYSTEKITISGLDAGYYSGASTLVLNSTFIDAKIAHFEAPTQDRDSYLLTPTSNIIKSVTIAKGRIEGSASAEADPDNAPGATVTAEMSAGGNVATAERSNATDYEISVTLTPQLSGKIKAAVSADSITPGYISGASDIVLTGDDYDISGIDVDSATKSYFVKHGKVGLKTADSSITQNVQTSLQLGTGTTDGYAVTASVTGLTLAANVSEGYVKDADVVLSSDDLVDATTPSTIYIKKGSVVGAANNPTEVSLSKSTDNGNIVESEDFAAPSYTVEVTADPLTLHHTTTEGYVTTAADLTVSGATQTLKIAHGSASAGIRSNTLAESGTSGALAASGKAFTISSTPVLGKSVTQGYVKDADVTLDTVTPATQTFYVKHGTVGTPSNNLTAVANFTDSENAVKAQIFKTAVPTAGDYFTVEANSSVSITEGWIESGDHGTVSNKYYIPKATFEYVNSDNIEGVAGAHNFIQVTTGGYIPSGAIVELDNELSEADYAVIGLDVTDSGAITNASLPTNYYEIVVGKGSVNAGYISDGNGTVTPETIKVAHGSVGTTGTITNIVKGNVTGNHTQGYKLGLTATGTVSTSVVNGYVKGTTDITVNGESTLSNADVTLTKEQEITLDSGSVSINVDNVRGSVASTSVQLSSEAISSYVITPTLSGAEGGNATAVVSTAEAGWIGTGYSANTNISLDSNKVTSMYLQAGTPLSNVAGSGTVAIANNFNEAVDGAYTISLASGDHEIAVGGTLAEGYYKSTAETTVSGAATVSGLTGAVSVAHGNVTVNSATASLALNSPEGLAVHTQRAEGASYYALTLSAESLDLGISTTQGYVKAGDVSKSATLTSVANTNAVTEYLIQRYTNSNKLADGSYNAIVNGMGNPTEGDVNNWVDADGVVGLDSDVLVINTADKYVEENITVQLHADAAGTNVRNELYLLQQRLAGKNVTSVQVA